MKLNDVLRVVNAASRASQGRPAYRRRRPGRKSGAAIIAAALTALVAWWQTSKGGSNIGSSVTGGNANTTSVQRPEGKAPSDTGGANPTGGAASTKPASNRPGSGAGQLPKDGERAILDAYKAQRSDFWATVSGDVVKVLPDDDEGDRHQKFLLELPSGHTLLIAHNIDIAPRVPVKEGDAVTLRGEYEWKEQGGVMHWTHHDPGGRRPGGWIEHAGKKYE